MAEALGGNARVTDLDIAHNSIAREGLLSLAAALQRHGQLTRLRAWGNELDDPQATAALALACQELRSLRECDVLCQVACRSSARVRYAMPLCARYCRLIRAVLGRARWSTTSPSPSARSPPTPTSSPAACDPHYRHAPPPFACRIQNADMRCVVCELAFSPPPSLSLSSYRPVSSRAQLCPRPAPAQRQTPGPVRHSASTPAPTWASRSPSVAATHQRPCRRLDRTSSCRRSTDVTFG